MPRKKTFVPLGGDVHTIFRTVNKEFLFKDSKDHTLFLNALLRQKRRYGVRHYAWVGMSNHHHVFHETPKKWHNETPFALKQREKNTPISYSVMTRDTQGYFSAKFNYLNGRDGALIKDRTKVIPVLDDGHALLLLIYIFLNPVRAGLIQKPEDYPFSNCNLYTSSVDSFKGLFSLHPSYLALGNSQKVRGKEFRNLLAKAQLGWGKSHWPGASASHSHGRGMGRKTLDEFITLAKHLS